MAEDSDNERTEPASEKRLEQARSEGRVARSSELSTFAMLMAGGGGLWFLGAHLYDALRELLANALHLDSAAAFDTSLMTTRLHEQALAALLIRHSGDRARRIGR